MTNRLTRKTTFPRSSAVLMHPTSLPGRYGIGDFRPGAYQFLDWLFPAGQSLLHVCPLGPIGYGNSPHRCLSAFDSGESTDYLPHNFYLHSAVHTGTHDNNTLQGWFHGACDVDRTLAPAYGISTRARADSQVIHRLRSMTERYGRID